MSNSVQISKIEIKIGQKALTFTLEEAKQLKDRLIELFPEKVTSLSSWPTYIPFQVYQPSIPNKWDVICSHNILKFTNKSEVIS